MRERECAGKRMWERGYASVKTLAKHIAAMVSVAEAIPKHMIRNYVGISHRQTIDEEK